VRPATSIQPTSVTNIDFEPVRASFVRVEIVGQWSDIAAKNIRELSFYCSPTGTPMQEQAALEQRLHEEAAKVERLEQMLHAALRRSRLQRSKVKHLKQMLEEKAAESESLRAEKHLLDEEAAKVKHLEQALEEKAAESESLRAELERVSELETELRERTVERDALSAEVAQAKELQQVFKAQVAECDALRADTADPCGSGYLLQGVPAGSVAGYKYCSNYEKGKGNPATTHHTVSSGVEGVAECKKLCDDDLSCTYYAKYGAYCNGICKSAWETKCIIIRNCGTQVKYPNTGGYGAVWCQKQAKQKQADIAGAWQDSTGSFYDGAIIRINTGAWFPEVPADSAWASSSFELHNVGGKWDLVEVKVEGSTHHHEAQLEADGLLWIRNGQWKLTKLSEAPLLSLQVEHAYCTNRGGIGGSNKYSKNVGKNNIEACAAHVKSTDGCGEWFDYGITDGWCDCVPLESGNCTSAGYSGYNVYLLQAASEPST